MPRGTRWGMTPHVARSFRRAVPGRLVMNPLRYESLYHKLTVSLDGLGTTTVDVHHYKNNGEAYVNNLLHGDDRGRDTQGPAQRSDQRRGRSLAAKAAARPKPSRITGHGHAFPRAGRRAWIVPHWRSGPSRWPRRSALRSWARRNAAAAVPLIQCRGPAQLPTLMVRVQRKGSPEEIATAAHA